MRPLGQAHPRRWSEGPAGDLRCVGDGSRRDPRARRPQEGGADGESPGEEAGGDQEGDARQEGRQEDRNPRDSRRGQEGEPGKAPGLHARPRPRARARRGDRGCRSLRRLVRLLAGRRRLGRRRGGEEGVPPGEDLRRRPDPAGRPAVGRHGPRGGAGRLPPLPGLTRLRLRPFHRHALAGAPELPRLRVHDHAARPRRPGGRARGGGRGDPAPGHRGDGARGGREGPLGRPAPDADRRHRQGEGRRGDPDHQGPLRRGGRRVQLTGGPHARDDTAAGPPHGHGPARVLPLGAPRRSLH